jgi:hypothetical protein
MLGRGSQGLPRQAPRIFTTGCLARDTARVAGGVLRAVSRDGQAATVARTLYQLTLPDAGKDTDTIHRMQAAALAVLVLGGVFWLSTNPNFPHWLLIGAVGILVVVGIRIGNAEKRMSRQMMRRWWNSWRQSH